MINGSVRCILILCLMAIFDGGLWSVDAVAAEVAEKAPGASPAAAVGAPIRVIFDTDIYGDIDDVLALGMLHALHDRGEISLIAVTVGTDAPWTAPYVDLVNTFYGHADIPIGMVRGGITAKRFSEKPFTDRLQPWAPQGVSYTQYLAQRRNPEGTLVYPHRLLDSSKAEEAVQLLRRVLAAQPDRSVVMIQVGYSTNFARLLDSPPDAQTQLSGRTLIEKKVKLLATMAGNFSASAWDGKRIPPGQPEFNLMMDVPAAQKVFSDWPTPIVASGFEVGMQMLFPQSSVEKYFNYVDRHPIAETYRYTTPGYRKASKNPAAPHDHPVFDLTSVLYASRPDEDYFSLSESGRITVLADGGTRFERVSAGSHRYLILKEEQKARALEAMVMLTSQPPVHVKR